MPTDPENGPCCAMCGEPFTDDDGPSEFAADLCGGCVRDFS